MYICLRQNLVDKDGKYGLSASHSLEERHSGVPNPNPVPWYCHRLSPRWCWSMPHRGTNSFLVFVVFELRLCDSQYEKISKYLRAMVEINKYTSLGEKKFLQGKNNKTLHKTPVPNKLITYPGSNNAFRNIYLLKNINGSTAERLGWVWEKGQNAASRTAGSVYLACHLEQPVVCLLALPPSHMPIRMTLRNPYFLKKSLLFSFFFFF